MIFSEGQEQFAKLAYLDQTIDLTRDAAAQESTYKERARDIATLKRRSETSFYEMVADQTRQLARTLGVQQDTLEATLGELAAKFKLNDCTASLKDLEGRLARDMTESESQLVFVEQLGENFSRWEKQRDLVRFNLYKACLRQLQVSFLKLFRLTEWLALEAYESDTFNDLTKQTFDQFSTYCAAVMEQRRQEVEAERRVVDTTVWPIEEKRGAETVRTDCKFWPNPFANFELTSVKTYRTNQSPDAFNFDSTIL